MRAGGASVCRLFFFRHKTSEGDSCYPTFSVWWCFLPTMGVTTWEPTRLLRPMRGLAP